MNSYMKKSINHTESRCLEDRVIAKPTCGLQRKDLLEAKVPYVEGRPVISSNDNTVRFAG